MFWAFSTVDLSQIPTNPEAPIRQTVDQKIWPESQEKPEHNIGRVSTKLFRTGNPIITNLFWSFEFYNEFRNLALKQLYSDEFFDGCITDSTVAI